MDGLLNCPACGAHNAADQRFCGSCGSPLSVECVNCGRPNRVGLAVCGSCGGNLGTTAATGSSPADERRLATVLFVDVSGWTSMTEELDPEDVKTIAHEVTQRMGAEVHRFGGTVISVMGDAIMAVFGAPVAHEDDAERAVRAAIGMRDSFEAVTDRPPIQIHIGINTGEGMAGLVGPEGRSDYTVVGDVTNTAARLQSAAGAGEILVGERTMAATTRVIDYEPHPPVDAKNKKEPVPVWNVVGVRHAIAERAGAGATFVGREEELELLDSIWDRALRTGHAHLVTLVGPPGIGKSRLIREVAPRIERAGRFVKGRCLPYGGAAGYGAFAQQVKQLAGILESDPESEARDALERHIRALPIAGEVDVDEVTTHLAILLGFATPHAADKPPLFLSARRYVEALGLQQPTALVFEDLHWADPALLDLIASFAQRIEDAPLLLLTSARPEFFEGSPAWGGGLRYSAIPLGSLSAAGSEQLARSLIGDDPDREGSVASLVRTSGGNPLFLEELAASIHEGGTGSLGGVPSTIQSIISARLDGLSRDERGLLQTASVVGRIFWHGAIRAMGWDGTSIDAALEALEGRDLILRQATSRLSGDTEYLFKHVLTMEVAYGTLPNRSRRELHATVARYLESTMGDRVRGSASLLARHWRRAGEPARSAPYLLLAAEVAAKAAAKEEAIALLTEAIELADEIGDEALRNRALLGRVRVRIDIGEHQAALHDVEPLLASPDLAVRGQALRARCRLAFVLTDAAGLQTHARETSEIAAEIGDAHLKIRAEALVGEAAFLHGDRTTFLDAAARADRSWPDDERDAEYGYTMSLVPLARYWDGDYEEGVRLARAAFDLGTELSSVYLMIFNVGGLAINLTGLSRYEEAFEWLRRGIGMGRDWESKPQWTGRLLNMHAGALREVGDLTTARTVSREGLEAGARAGFLGASVSAGIDLAMTDVVEGEIGRAEQQMPELIRAVEDFHGWHQWLWTGRLLDMQAEIAVGSGRYEDAADKTSEALRYLERYPRPKYEAKARTLQGRAMLGLGLLEEAGVSFRRAIALAEGLHQSMLHWPALDGLAMVLDGSGREAETEATRLAARAIIDDIADGLAVERRPMFLGLPSVAPVLDRTGPPGP